MTTHRPGKFLRSVLRAPTVLYDWRLGWLLGHRFIRLSHTGRHSGRPYQAMLEVLRIDHTTEEIVVVAGLGRATDWLRNLEAGGTAKWRSRPADSRCGIGSSAPTRRWPCWPTTSDGTG